MGRLLKYEIKEHYKFFSGVYITTLAIAVMSWIFGKKYDNAGFAFVVLGITSIVINLIIFIMLINSLRNDLYEERGYLLFTLPRNSYEIVGSKIISALIWIVITGILMFVLLDISSTFIPSSFYNELFKFIDENNMKLYILVIFAECLLGTMLLFILIYFSIIVSKVAVKNRKLGAFISFVVLIFMIIGYTYLKGKISVIFPQSIEFPFIFRKDMPFSEILYEDMHLKIGSVGSMEVNISSIILDILAFAGLFIGSSKLLDKMDL